MKKIIKALLDENNADNIILNFDGIEVEFEQVALIENRTNLYSILRPITLMEGIDNDEGVIFYIDEVKSRLVLVEDEEIISEIYEVYNNLLEE